MSEIFTRLKQLSEQEKTKGLLSELNKYSPPTHNHSISVGGLSYKLANCDPDLSLGDKKIIYRGGLLHDIGKIAVPTWILLRDEKTVLSVEDDALLKSHGIIGKTFLDELRFDKIYGIIADQHYIGIEKNPPEKEDLERRHPLVPYVSIADLIVSSLDSNRRYQEDYRPKRVINDVRSRFDKEYLPSHLRPVFERMINLVFPHHARVAAIK